MISEGIRLLRQGNADRALQQFLIEGADPETHPELAYYLGLCYTHLEQYDEALLHLEQVVASELGIAYVYQGRMILGYIYATTHRFRLAEFEFRRILKDGFESAKSHAALAYVLFAQGESDEAQDELRTALRLDPENPTALNSLGFILAETGGDLSRALDCCRRAVKLNPKNPAYLDSLGWVYYRLGRLDLAADSLRRALEIVPGNREIAGHVKTVMEERRQT